MSKPILIFCMFVFLGACTPRTYDMKKYEIWVGLGLDETPKEEFVVLSPLKWNKIHNVSRLQIKVSDIEFYKIYEKFVSASKTECGFLDCCFLVMQVKRNNELLEYLTIHHPVVDLNIVGKDDAGADMGYGIRSLELTSLFYKTLRQEIDKYELDFSSLNLTESEEQR